MSTDRASNQSKLTIQSYVILDFETTGLFPQDPLNPFFGFPEPGNDKRRPDVLLAQCIHMTSPRDSPQIVEMCAISAARSQLLDGIERMNDMNNMDDDHPSTQQPYQHNHDAFVRIPHHVHTRQVKPNLTEREWREYEKRRCVTKMIKLSRSALEECNTFADEWAGLHLFLDKMPKPVCIIAHNGVRFDYRVLFAEMQRHDLLKTKPIPNKVYFIDSYLMFMDLEKKHHEELRTLTELINWRKLASHHQLQQSETTYPSSSTVNPNDSPVPNSFQRRPDSQQCTPPSVAITNNDSSKSTSTNNCTAKRSLFDSLDDHPIQFMRNSQWSPAKRKRTRRNLFKRSRGNWVFDNYTSVRYFHENGVFKLEQMYKELINKHLEAHHAQDDCEALLQVCMAYGQEFIDYVDSKAVRFPYDTIISSKNNNYSSTTHQ